MSGLLARTAWLLELHNQYLFTTVGHGSRWRRVFCFLILVLAAAVSRALRVLSVQCYPGPESESRDEPFWLQLIVSFYTGSRCLDPQLLPAYDWLAGYRRRWLGLR